MGKIYGFKRFIFSEFDYIIRYDKLYNNTGRYLRTAHNCVGLRFLRVTYVCVRAPVKILVRLVLLVHGNRRNADSVMRGGRFLRTAHNCVGLYFFGLRKIFYSVYLWKVGKKSITV